MNEPIRRLDRNRPTIPPVVPVQRRRRTHDEREPDAEEQDGERREPAPAAGEGPDADGHIDVLA